MSVMISKCDKDQSRHVIEFGFDVKSLCCDLELGDDPMPWRTQPKKSLGKLQDVRLSFEDA